MQINYSLIEEAKEELEMIPDYIPFLITHYIFDMNRYYDNLKKHNMYDDVRNKQYQMLQKMRENQFDVEVEYEELAKWCHENPKYMKFII